jgi:hypothetical protein
MEEMVNEYNILVSKLEWKRSHGRSRCRWNDNIVARMEKKILSRNRKKQKPAGLSYDEMAAMDREDWRKLLKKARAHTGLSS